MTEVTKFSVVDRETARNRLGATVRTRAPHPASHTHVVSVPSIDEIAIDSPVCTAKLAPRDCATRE